MSRNRWATAIGCATAIVGLAFAAIPLVASLEESLGLRLLFYLRGETRPPDQVVLVSLDEASAARLGMPTVVRDWPRSAYAALVDRLVEHGASAIGFDVQFFRHRDSDVDLAFAEAVARSRRVVLIQSLELVRSGDREMWERQDPIPVLTDAAFGLAPVPVPDLDVITWTWSFLDTPTAGEIPTLPAVMLQVKALPVTGELIDIATEAGIEGLADLPRTAAQIRQPANLLRLMQTLRRQIQLRPSLVVESVAKRVTGAPGTHTDDQARLLLALTDLYASQAVRHLNFYGPPGHICTIPYEVAVSEPSRSTCALDGAVVLVGLANGRVERTGQPDTYHAAYPTSDGIDFSGIEIQATALANLLTRTDLHPATAATQLVGLSLVGLLLGPSVYWVRTRRRPSRRVAQSRWEATGTAVGLIIVYSLVAYLVFLHAYTVLPMLVPVAAQLPVALAFGLLAPPAPHRLQVHAVCLATDAGGSTAVGQRLAHGQYAQLMDDYRRSLTNAVRAHGGEPVPPEGDGLVCVWCGPAASGATMGIGRAIRLRAVQAALEVVDGATRFNQKQMPEHQLPTRVGLSIGLVTIHSDADRGVFEIVGDAVNVAGRLRDLNRELGTSLLASEDVAEGLTTTLTLRHVPDIFTLKGIHHTPHVVEILGITTDRTG